MRTRFSLASIILLLTVFSLSLASCSSSANLVVSNGANISKYKYVSFGKEQSGDRELDDVLLLVQNEIANTKLQPISLTYAPDDYLGHTLTPHINVKSENGMEDSPILLSLFTTYIPTKALPLLKAVASVCQSRKTKN